MKTIFIRGNKPVWTKLRDILETDAMVCLSIEGFDNRYFAKLDGKYYVYFSLGGFFEIDKDTSVIFGPSPDSGIMKELFADAIMEELL